MSDLHSPTPEIEGFSIIGQAGRGGMGTVFIAEQHAPRRTVALKVLSRAPKPETLAEFRREAALIARLEHPRIVPLYGYGEHAGIPYLVMRYIGGGSLADKIKTSPQDLNSAEHWLRAIAEALDFSHEQGLVHRDVKPSNILLDEDGNAYLSDFGIAGTVADAESGLPSGSAAYMSPEQSKGGRVDRRADVYALAVSLFEVLTGQKPYTAETALGVMARHMHDPIPSAREINPLTPEAPNELLLWAMAKQPEQRPQSAGEMVRIFRHAIQHPELPLRAPSADELQDETTTPAQPIRRRTSLWLAIGLGLAAIALIGGGALMAALLPAEDSPRSTATLPVVATTSAEQDLQNGEADASLLLADDFSDAGSGFAVLSDADGGVEYANGSLRFSVLNEGVRWYSPSGQVEAQDVVIEVTAFQVSGPPQSEIAILCRWRDLEHFVALAIRADGAVAVWQVSGGELSWLLEWISEADLNVQPDVPLQLRATCQGEVLRFEVDGITRALVNDPRPDSGDIALMAGLGEPGELVVLFDDLTVSR
jgi:serine/threonine protein kinase